MPPARTVFHSPLFSFFTGRVRFSPSLVIFTSRQTGIYRGAIRRLDSYIRPSASLQFRVASQRYESLARRLKSVCVWLFRPVGLEFCKAKMATDAPHPTPHQSTSLTASPKGEALVRHDLIHISFQNSILDLLKEAHIKKPSPLGEGGRGSARMRGSREAASP